MKNKNIVLYSLLIVLAGAIYFGVWALQKNDKQAADFSGEWKAKASISMGGNIVCTFVEGDRMLAETMTIAEQPGYLTIEASSSFPGTGPITSKEKLVFDGRESQVDHGLERGKKYTVNLSPDRKTMTVNTIVHLVTAKPYHVEVQEKMLVYLTETWKLSADGQSITVQAKAKSNLFSKDERSWETVFNKVD